MVDPLRNLCVTAVREELSRYGLKSEAEVVNNGHVEVRWEWNGERRRSRMSATPSDRFSHLKALAEVKRVLRQDGAQPSPRPTRGNVLTLSHALSAPIIPPPPNERISKLESDFEGLFELFVAEQLEGESLRAQVETLQAKLSSLRVTVSFDDGTAVAASAPASPASPATPLEVPAKRSRGSGENTYRARVLKALAGRNWCNVGALSKECVIATNSLGAVLSKLREAGLVENGQRGWWRKVPEVRVPAQTG